MPPAVPANRRLPLPAPRGPLTEALLPVLQRPPEPDLLPRGPVLTALVRDVSRSVGQRADEAPEQVVQDDDVQLALFVLYELHYRGVEGVDDAWEWHPGLLSLRARLERVWEGALRAWVPGDPAGMTAESVVEALHELTIPSPRPALASYLARTAALDEYRELLVHRSLYHLKEADPHSFAIPRLSGSPKAALVEVQADEYGGGRPEWVHATLFARSMRALGLDDAYGRYVDAVPAVGLAVVNAMSLFGLHRRLLGAIVGHLAAFEMTSTQPNRLYAQGLRRLGAPPEAVVYFDEHVEADAVHEQIACRRLAAGLVTQDGARSTDVLFGARTALRLDDAASAFLLGAWQAGRSALRSPDPAAAGSHVPA